MVRASNAFWWQIVVAYAKSSVYSTFCSVVQIRNCSCWQGVADVICLSVRRGASTGKEKAISK